MLKDNNISKLNWNDVKKIAHDCCFNTILVKMEGKKILGVHHKHEWDHGYESEMGYNGTRREFYADMREMFNFLLDYVHSNKIEEFIVAPLFQPRQVSYWSTYSKWDKLKYICKEFRDFLQNFDVNINSRSGIKMSIKNNSNVIEMLMECSFLDDFSNLSIMFPSQSLVVKFNHHFDITFFTPNFEKEKEILTNLLKNHIDIIYYEKTYE